MDDLRQSHDFEDIIYVLANNSDIVSIIKSSQSTVRSYLKEQYKILTERSDILEGIECALPYYADSDSVEKIVTILEFE